MIGIVFMLLIIGICVSLFQAYVPIAQPFKSIIVAVAVLCVIFWLLDVAGILGTGVSYHHRMFCDIGASTAHQS